MEVLLFVVILLICIALMGVVLVQNSKGGGLSADFASSNQYMGVRKTADFLEKATWGLAIALFVFCLLATAMRPQASTVIVQDQESKMAQTAAEYTGPTQAGTQQELLTPVPGEGEE